MKKGALSHLAVSGASLSVKVTPKATRNAIEEREGKLRIYITTAPEDGKANKAVVKLLSNVLGIAKSRLVLTQGATSRDKVIQID
ncbi:DUF167 domain-containing protein [Aliiroseovarius sp. 2305UL8-7]|uniref:DUF167 domain-containing protein n=1 Tax=Aliiroseovarius conchicola TaxID=3121637 RepID=UPI00352969CE